LRSNRKAGRTGSEGACGPLAACRVKPGNDAWVNRLIDPIRERFRFRLALDCPADWSDRSGVVAILLIAVCYAAGLAVHCRWYEESAVPSLSFDAGNSMRERAPLQL
jgi:hypothetical protein